MAGHPIRASRAIRWLRRLIRNDQLILSLLAIVVGGATACAVVLFRETIGAVQFLAHGSGDESIFLDAAGLSGWRVVLALTAGGLAVGLLVHFFMPGRRNHGVAEVVEACALRAGRMSPRTGLVAFAVGALSIGVGASTGREGPAVHIGGTIGGWIAHKLHLTRALSRTLLGCGVAAAVAASFNAPIAGALFANEVVVGHYALSAFAPIVISSVTATMISRGWFGDSPAFFVPEYHITSFLELPAFVGLGLVAAVAAIALIRGIGLAEEAAGRMKLPTWARPAIGGLVLGLVALAYPQVLGIGYATTDAALSEALPLITLAVICGLKIFSTAVSLGFGFGGGVFSPSIVIGATLGGIYGIAATALFPELSSGPGAYAIIGMGAVAASVLGAPISTTLIVFEMTGDYALTVAVMVAVVVSSVTVQQFMGHSFFTWQLARRGLDLKGGLEHALLRNIRVRDVMAKAAAQETVSPQARLPEIRHRLQACETGELFVIDGDGRLVGTITIADLSDTAFDHGVDDLINAADVARHHPPTLTDQETLERGIKLIRETGEPHIAVIDSERTSRFLGCIHERDAMNACNRALVEYHSEER